MELLAYFLALFGFLIMIKGINPTLKWINKSTDKELVKGVGFISILLTIGFYLYIATHYLLNFD